MEVIPSLFVTRPYLRPFLSRTGCGVFCPSGVIPMRITLPIVRTAPYPHARPPPLAGWRMFWR